MRNNDVSSETHKIIAQSSFSTSQNAHQIQIREDQPSENKLSPRFMDSRVNTENTSVERLGVQDLTVVKAEKRQA